MTFWRGHLLIGIGLGLAVAVLATLSLATPPAANAFIDEKIGAGCRKGGEPVEPPGIIGMSSGKSLVRSLIATGIISSVDESVEGQVTINFDLDKPSSKFMSAGFDLTIPDGEAPGVDLILSPLPISDPDFAAHANCKNLRP